ncbi:MAG TPA: hypothetical protein DF712_21500 [Balneola sp.]|nr:hypothetical protein [Bacteroidota bacterium]HCT55030.1 hypothetical protein [Balneola sp.]|tara:strand:+ start:22098 stop:23726 length:1629 start_codon:yes stop_codon:yes gene_type:complete
MKKTVFVSFLILGLWTLFISCGSNSVSDQGDEEYVPIEGCRGANCLNFIKSAFYDMATGIVSSTGVTMGLLADQYTSTNIHRNYYDLAREPREALTNSTTDEFKLNIEEFYQDFSEAYKTADHFTEYARSDDSTFLMQSLGMAYFIRGVSQGYLGLIYDKVYLREFDSVEGGQLLEYSELIESSLSDLDKAISLFEEDPDFEHSNLPGNNNSLSNGYLMDIANSFAARILAGEARTYGEAQYLDWNRVFNYAIKGLGGAESFTGIKVFSLNNSVTEGQFENYFADWSNFIVEGDFETGSGYTPTDVKIFHLLDSSYPTIYPENEIRNDTLTLRRATSIDLRLEYYKYTTNKGILNEERDVNLFSTYFNKRMFSENDWWLPENKIIIFTDTETKYLMAEAKLMMGENTTAANILNQSPAKNTRTDLGFDLPAVRNQRIQSNGLTGNHSYDGSESIAEFQLALLREYSVELEGLGGVGLQWFFMRRHDLLQEGTATMYPIPESKLLEQGIPHYTFGGVENAGQRGTASGANSWKNLRAKIAAGN